MTFYLKYRPQSLEELDQDSVRITLQKIVLSKDLPHAFLFAGPKGTGKTSAARILAKIVNCESNDSKKRGRDLISPCNECETCKSITRGDNIDVMELDAASHRGIDDVRMIRDAVKLAPAGGKKKIYIIDEAHMLTTEASNALLKTLEEPPAHVIFILATTNPEKLIDTIRSRVTYVNFKKATNAEIVKSLSKIVEKEGVKVDAEVLTLMAGYSDGSFRDATKVLEQVITEGQKFDIKSVESLISGRKSFDIDRFVADMAKKDSKKLINSLEESIQKGSSAREIGILIIERLRNMLLAKVGVNDEFNSEFTNNELVNLTKLFTEAYSKIQFSPIEQLPLEIAIVDWVGESKVVYTELDGNSAMQKPIQKVPQAELVKETQTQKITPVVHEAKAKNTDKKEVLIDNSRWLEVLAAIKQDHASTEALLRAAKPLRYDGETLTLGVYYKFHKEHLEGNAHRRVLENVLSDKFEIPVRVVCELTEPEVSIAVPSNREEVVLTEIKNDTAPSNIPLTGNGENDIMKIAEKIFGN